MKNSNKSKYVYGGYGKAFKGCVGSWSFGNGFARNVAILMFIRVHHIILIIAKIMF